MKTVKYFFIALLLFSNNAFSQISKIERQKLIADYDLFYNEQLMLAENGEAKAQYAVSLMLAIGLGNIKADAKNSIEWANKSAKQGNVDAKRLLAAHAHFENNESRLSKAASTGELKAPYSHILMKYRKIDPKKLKEGLIKKFKNASKTADMGYPKSHLQLVEMYYEGTGTRKDVVKAAKWAYIASASPHSNDELLFNKVISELDDLQRKIAENEAEFWLKENNILYEETSWVEPADNNPNFLFKTTDYLYEPIPKRYRRNGRTTTITNPKIRYTPQTNEELERFSTTLEKAKNGDNNAKLELASLYQKQIGVTYDGDEALRWTKDAADNGHVEAQYLYASNLIKKASLCPENKKFDEAEIIKYYTLAAEKGHLKAQGVLATSYSSGHQISRNYNKSFKWSAIAAERGHTRAQFTLSKLYLNGNGVTKDLVQAYKWGVISRQYNDVIKNDYVMSIEEQLSENQLKSAKILIDKWLDDNRPESFMDKILKMLI